MNVGVTSFEMSPGLGFRPVIGQGLAVNMVSFAPNTVVPVHAHDEEQVLLMLEGELEFEVSGEKRLLKPGQGVVIPPNTPHGARTYDTPAVEVDIFHPPRKGLLDAIGARQEAAADGEE
jgi:quercetin dioxygenase-like cupin family protein